MPTRRSTFIVQVDPSVKLSSKSRAELTAAIGSSAAASLARLDLRGTLAFIPRIDWPGGIIIDLGKLVPAAKLKELQTTKIG